jgi:iron complex outermembrane receptor protein
MQYNDLLVLNGQINNVGAYNRINVASSYRRGVELELGSDLSRFFNLAANLSLSTNKIAEFTEFVDVYDTNGDFVEQTTITHKNTDISFSPNAVSSVVFTIKPSKNFEISLIDKYVGRQYLDNTSDVNKSIDPYNVVDLRLNYTIHSRLVPEINILFAVYNVLSTKYSTNGYTYGSYTGTERYSYNFFAPAAPLNFMGGISLKF